MDKKYFVYIGLVVIIIIIFYIAGSNKHNDIIKNQNTNNALSNNTMGTTTNLNNNEATNVDKSQLKIEDLIIGSGKETKNGDKIEVNYIGTLTNGQKFDSSYDRKQTFEFTLGNHEVIQGWDQGIIGMKEGGKRKLTIPPELAYGNKNIGPIAANSTLVFEVELIKIK